MRGTPAPQATMLTAVTPDALVPPLHPIRQIKPMVDAALAKLWPTFNRMYAEDGRPYIPRALVLRKPVCSGSPQVEVIPSCPSE